LVCAGKVTRYAGEFSSNTSDGQQGVYKEVQKIS
jgi:hypothetical protein